MDTILNVKHVKSLKSRGVLLENLDSCTINEVYMMLKIPKSKKNQWLGSKKGRHGRKNYEMKKLPCTIV